MSWINTCVLQKLARLIFKLKAQVGQYSTNLMRSLRLFGLHGDVNDAHRAGANRLQHNKQQLPLRTLAPWPRTTPPHRMRSIAPWRYTTFSQVMSPTSSTTSTTQRLLQRSSRMNPVTQIRSLRTRAMRNSTMSLTEECYLHHCSLRSEKNQRT